MDEKHKLLLANNRSVLADSIEFEKISELLVRAKVLSKEQIDNIKVRHEDSV